MTPCILITGSNLRLFPKYISSNNQHISAIKSTTSGSWGQRPVVQFDHYQSNPNKHNTSTLHDRLLLLSTSCFVRSFDHQQVEDTSTQRKGVL
jgi:hypothetical protein